MLPLEALVVAEGCPAGVEPLLGLLEREATPLVPQLTPRLQRCTKLTTLDEEGGREGRNKEERREGGRKWRGREEEGGREEEKLTI